MCLGIYYPKTGESDGQEHQMETETLYGQDSRSRLRLGLYRDDRKGKED